MLGMTEIDEQADQRGEQQTAEVEVSADREPTAPEVLDARVRKVLELVARGMPVLELDESFDADAHHALAREAAAQSVVLLVNDGVLPLTPDASIAVIGEFARTPRFQGAPALRR